jgi:hypothetical protein
MSSRNQISVFDAALAREHTQAELRANAAPKKMHEVMECNKIGGAPVEMSAEAKANFALALQKELEKAKKREDERRRRDPTFREDALDLDKSKMRKFYKFIDYYGHLQVDKYCSAAELKEAYRKRSLEFHPDKQLGRSEEEKVVAEEGYHLAQKAYDILTEPATRRAYDAAFLLAL